MDNAPRLARHDPGDTGQQRALRVTRLVEGREVHRRKPLRRSRRRRQAAAAPRGWTESDPTDPRTRDTEDARRRMEPGRPPYLVRRPQRRLAVQCALPAVPAVPLRP